MHRTSVDEMRDVLKKLDQNAPLTVLDVGSRMVGAGPSYRELMAEPWVYVGCDFCPGQNVDLVQIGEYHIQEAADQYDVVISGQCLEHVRRPWRLVAEMARVLRPGGFMALVAPWQWPVHKYPLDCWRILPDGMQVILEDAGVERIEVYVRATDCWGLAHKPGRKTA